MKILAARKDVFQIFLATVIEMPNDGTGAIVPLDAPLFSPWNKGSFPQLEYRGLRKAGICHVGNVHNIEIMVGVAFPVGCPERHLQISAPIFIAQTLSHECRAFFWSWIFRVFDQRKTAPDHVQCRRS